MQCDNSFEGVNVLELLDGIRLDKIADWASKESAPGRPREIRIFPASSSELGADRDAFDLHFRQLNDEVFKQGFYLKIVRWENFLDAMSETRLQDEYNKAIRECDVFVSLFFTKTGKFTEEEFDVAHRQFKRMGLPFIYTFFKSAEVNIEALPEQEFLSLRAFQKKLADLDHFKTNYRNIADLKLQFTEQLKKLPGRRAASG